MNVTLANHPTLRAAAFVTVFARPIAELASPEWLVALLRDDAEAPVRRPENVQGEIRDMMRHGGYKPTGRGKPASEYLVRAAGEGKLRSINAPVDVCNVVSLHSGVPISVVDLERTQGALAIGLAPAEASYVFNASGQEIKVAGLVCLHDGEGPCANGVKDSQRTKTHEGTTRTLTVLWGAQSLGEHTAEAAAWYRELLVRLGATTEDVALVPGDSAREL